MIDLYIVVHLCSFLIMMGFCLRKAESPFIEADWEYWSAHIILNIFAAPALLLIVLGAYLHGE